MLCAPFFVQADFTNTFRALSYIPTRATDPSSNGDGSNTSTSTSSSTSEAAPESTPQPLESTTAARYAALAAGLPETLVDALTLEALMEDPLLIDQWSQWLRVWRARLQEEGLSDAERMKMQQAVSPKFVPRQHLLQVRRVALGPSRQALMWQGHAYWGFCNKV